MTTNDTAPTVSPTEGCYVRLRNGETWGPLTPLLNSGSYVWELDGRRSWMRDGGFYKGQPLHELDIVEIIPNPNAPEQEGPVSIVKTCRQVIEGRHGRLMWRPTVGLDVLLVLTPKGNTENWIPDWWASLTLEEIEVLQFSLSQIAQALRGNA